ncbi:hypothetical protein J6590_100116 [Homalodisca vitripennis]|nr:hypothetical protein J6590_100116 [Homalodisca vitripennis]
MVVLSIIPRLQPRTTRLLNIEFSDSNRRCTRSSLEGILQHTRAACIVTTLAALVTLECRSTLGPHRSFLTKALGGNPFETKVYDKATLHLYSYIRPPARTRHTHKARLSADKKEWNGAYSFFRTSPHQTVMTRYTRRVHFWLVSTFQLNPQWVQQKPMCHLNLGNLMDIQERHITNRKCRNSGVQG